MARAHAGERIKWPDLQRRLGGTSCALQPCQAVVEHRSITVVTSDGVRHHGRELTISSDGLRLVGGGPTQNFPREAVRHIEIRNVGRYSHHIRENAALGLLFAATPCMESENCNSFLLLLSMPLGAPVWSYTVASAPVFLVADGISLFVPAAKFDLIP